MPPATKHRGAAEAARGYPGEARRPTFAALFALTAAATACGAGGGVASAGERRPDAPPRPAVVLTYLGNAGWQIDDGHTIVLVDPYLSQFHDRRGANPIDDEDPIASPSAAEIDAHVRRADYILITHGHVDHMLDAPYISRKTGAVIIGHETAMNLARAYDVADDKLITVRGGEDYDFGAFSLRVIPALHSALFHKRYANSPMAGIAPRGLRPPLHESAFVEGGTLAYLLRIGGRKIFIMGGMNFIERELTGLDPDVALLGAGESRNESYEYTSRLMRALGSPRLVLPTHGDAYASKSLSAATANLLQFSAEITRVSPRTRVIMPPYFQPIPLP